MNLLSAVYAFGVVVMLALALAIAASGKDSDLAFLGILFGFVCFVASLIFYRREGR